MNTDNGRAEILIAEDSPTQAELLQQLLEAHKYKVAMAANGKLALEQIARRLPALVISDVLMPELDGYGLCKAIKSDENLKHIPVMLVTTLSDPDDVIRGLECGADNFIRKPYDEKYLLARIDYLLMNVEIRKNQRMEMALEINLGGKKHFINAERQQILDLLVSTYEQAVQVNNELKEREKELAHTNQVLQGLNRFAEDLNSAVSTQEVAETALQRAMELPGIQAGWIFLRTGEHGYRVAAASGLPAALSGPDAFQGDCACQRQLLQGTLPNSINISQCERLVEARGDTLGLNCHATLPLWLGEGAALGLMNLAGYGNRLFSDEELEVLHSVGNQVAVALERARLHEGLETLVMERTAKLAAEIEERKRIEQAQFRVTGELESANAALKNERAHLAERVDERTAELTLANEELERAKATAEDASRAKSAFLAAMSHEIRTPMNGVVGMVDVLMQSSLTEHQADLANTIRDSAHALLGIIDDILDFSKIEAGRLELEREPVCVPDVVESLCCSLVPVAARKGVDLALFVSPDTPEQVVSDEVRLRQVLYNLIGNAIKFSGGRPDRRGQVSVRVEVVQTAPLRLSLSIADNGIGMRADTVRGLFTPFSQAEISTTRRYGGTGLGLTICKRLVELMQGEIAVDSMPDVGSTFTVTLPFELAAEQPARSQPDLSGLTCIVVDHPALRAGDIRAYLQHAGAQVRVARDEAEAAGMAAPLAGSVVLIRKPDEPATHPAAPPFAGIPHVRQLLLTYGRRLRARVGPGNTVSFDSGILRRQALLRAVAVAAGRASPEIFHDHPEKSLAHAIEPPSIAEARARGHLILVVEDDEINQKVILTQLALLGYAAEVAGDGAEALRLWREGGYALLLTDLHMPEMDGYALANAIRHEESGPQRIPILALTANALRGEANRVREAGMDEYMTKPIQLATLKTMLEKWLPGTGGAAPASAPASQAGGRDKSVLDVSVLTGLIGNDPALVNEFLADYLSASRTIAAEMRAALAAEDARQIGAIAHKLKSASRSVGALALGDLCAELENLGKTGDPVAIARGMAQFDAAFAMAETHIAGLLAGQ